MENKQLETEFEENRLKKTIEIAEQQLKQARETIKGKETELLEAKKEVRENAPYTITNLYNAQDFEALIELTQYINPVTEIIADYEEEKQKVLRLENVVKSPYFARIDFQFEDEDEAEKIYIGQSSLMEKGTREIYVYDWRSPIASVFYRFMTGKAFYDAPGGKIEGEVKLKRQYEIENGKLEFFFDTDMNISDEFLRQMLSKNTSPRMKAIVETIQKEQDIVIRDMENELLMVQGVAGSGKTSIALHRAAYLMYQGLQSRLTATSILIISPNSVFEQYISNVLPELGEKNVVSVVFEDIIHTCFRDRPIQHKNEFLEKAVTNNRYRAVVKGSMEFKTSESFARLLDRFISDMPLHWIEFNDIYYGDTLVVDQQSLKDWVMRRPETALGTRLEQLEEYILELVSEAEKKRENREERGIIKQEIQKFTKVDIIGLYNRLFHEKDSFCRLAEGMEMPEDFDEIWEYTQENMESGRLYYDDAIAITYLYLKIYGTGAYRNIKQVVIDEAQDYYPLQYEIFRLLFPNAKFTVLGDMNQTLAKQENLSLYEQIGKILNKKSASLITLDKSFRCTNEILQFSLQFIEHKPEIESFNRKGDSPKLAAFNSREDFLDGIIEEIEVCREKGLKTICLICKNEKNSVRLYENLKSRIDLQLIREENAEDLEGVFVMPVYMAKGLEFDAVLICDVNGRNYSNEDDKNLLYVECTRALHRLSLFGEGKISPLIGENSR